MILYFSGCGYKPEELFRKTSLMLSFFRSLKKPEKRFRKIYKQRKNKKMIMYYSGRCCGEYEGLLSRPEYLFLETNVMLSYTYAQKADLKRFLEIVNKRKRRKQK